MGEHEVGKRGAELEGVTVGKSFDTFCVAKAVTLPEQPIDMDFAATPQASPYK